MLPWISLTNCQLKRKTTLVFLLGVVFVFFFAIFASPIDVHAQEATNTLGIAEIDDNIALASTDIRVIVVRIINVFLGLLGIITVGLIIYAGFLYMTSGGSEEKIAQARRIMMNAVIGLIIIMSAWAITKFILNALSGGGGSGVSQDDPIVLSSFGGSGGLGRTIQDHYPFRDQVDVARNTSIVITFATPVEPSSFVTNTNKTYWDGENSQSVTTTPLVELGDSYVDYHGDCIPLNDAGDEYDEDGMVDTSNPLSCDQVVTSSIAIFELTSSTVSIGGSALMSSSTFRDNTSFISATALLRYEQLATESSVANNVYTVVLKPHNYLGSNLEDVWHGVYISNEITKKNGQGNLFDGQISPYYYWKFQTGTELDLDPPRVETWRPITASDKSVEKNVMIEVTFSEPVDPIVASGVLDGSGYSHMLVNMDRDTAPGFDTMVTGTWRISNGYRTVEFLSAEACGQNSCGDTMYCMPVTCNGDTCSQEVGVLLRTALSIGNEEMPFESEFDTGIYDLAFNGLSSPDAEGNFDEILQKPSEGNKYKIQDDEKNPDNFFWEYNVNNKIDRKPPYVAKVFPSIDGEDIEENAEVEMHFSKAMRTFSLRNIKMEEYPANVCSGAALVTSTDPADQNVCENTEKLDDFGYVVRGKILPDTSNTIAYVDNARPYGPYDLDLYYWPIVTDDVMDGNQNCVYPGQGPKSAKKNVDNVECKVTFDETTGNVTDIGSNCILQNMTSSTADSGCSFAYDDSSGDEGDLLQSSSTTCRNFLKDSNISPSTYCGKPGQPLCK